MTQLAFHPLADIFPLLDGEPFDQLIADIRANGLQQDIWTLDGTILDGRNRYRACLAADVPPRFRAYQGDDAVGFVVSLNLHRRHLNESQRAMVAAKLASLDRGKRADRSIDPSTTQQQAAEMLNVSVPSVKRARQVLQAAPELRQAVERGAVSVSAAADVAQLPNEQQIEIVARGEREILEAAKRIRAANHHRIKGTGENEWYTPPEYVEAAREMMGGIDLDPASSEMAQQTVRAADFYTVDDDGLTKAWDGRVWCNPPYAQPAIYQFIEKACAEHVAGRMVEGVVLTHNYTDTQWFHLAASHAAAICFTRGRIAFVSPAGEKAAPTQGQAFFYFGRRPDAFARAFSQFGFVVSKCGA